MFLLLFCVFSPKICSVFVVGCMRIFFIISKKKATIQSLLWDVSASIILSCLVWNCSAMFPVPNDLGNCTVVMSVYSAVSGTPIRPSITNTWINISNTIHSRVMKPCRKVGCDETFKMICQTLILLEGQGHKVILKFRKMSILEVLTSLMLFTSE